MISHAISIYLAYLDCVPLLLFDNGPQSK